MKASILSPLFLSRLALAFVFIYSAIAAIADPATWIGFLPIWLREFVQANFYISERSLLSIVSVYELFLALWLISGKRGFYSAIAAAVTLGAIVITNTASMLIVFRDIGLLIGALSLALLEKRNNDN